MAKTAYSDVDLLCINTLRTLAMDAVEKAKSGHPGMPMGAAPMAYVLWTRFLRHNPANPHWPNRDRFILSAGHGSMLLYGLLHLTGYDLSLEELQRFRQWASRTPGHPEFGLTPGVEATTGPLGQGFAMGVGMAIAERFLAARFNRPGIPVVDHHVYVLCSDGDLMEGISSEAASLAGHLGLGKLVYLYDDNQISIEGHTSLAFSEDVLAKFSALGWHVARVEDGNDLVAIEQAIAAARAEESRPSLIAVRTRIGYGSPHREGTAEAHGQPLGADEVRLTKRNLGWPEDAEFWVPPEVLRTMREGALARGQQWEAQWRETLARLAKEDPEAHRQWEEAMSGRLPAGWNQDVPRFEGQTGALATRSASGQVLNALAKRVPYLIGGSADLAPSNDTTIREGGDHSRDNPGGRVMHFGVREHAMGAILNGMSLHGGVIPFGGTFLVFSDYMRPAIRLASLMERHVIYVFTHDSIGLGEDGPTHQPVEHLMSLRAIPNLTVIRPADAAETAVAWEVALEHSHGPVALVLTRQKVPHLDRSRGEGAEGLRRGGYVVHDPEGGSPQVVLIATGSEVHVALEAAKLLAQRRIRARVVSLPSFELFFEQPQEYRDRVLPPEVRARVSVEAGVTLGWERILGDHGRAIGLDHFGASAPGEVLMEKFGFTPGHVAEVAASLVQE